MIKTLLFDFGNVFIDINFQKTTDAMRKLGLNIEKAEKLLFDPDSFFRHFQMGKISCSKFIAEVRKLAPIHLSDKTIIDAWCAMIGSVAPKHVDLLKSLRGKYYIALFSNTDAIHAKLFEEDFSNNYGFQLSTLFDKVFYSHEIGKAKPDLDAFNYVIKELNVNPETILFLDDIPSNVEGAINAGMQAALIEDNCNPRIALEKYGIINSQLHFIDTHAHIYMKDYDEDLEQVLNRANDAGVRSIIMPSTSANSIEELVTTYEKYPNQLELSFGLHPSNVDVNYKYELQHIYGKVKEHLTSLKAIGEIGIDLYHSKQYLTHQMDAFHTQLQWARDLDLPVIIHSRDAFPQVFEVLESFPDIKGVFHCFSGSEEIARKLIIEDQFVLGIGGVATFKNSKLLRILKKVVPLNKIVLETDAPFLAPTPHRGKRNESSYIPLIAQYIADTYETSLEHVSKITTENATKLFRL